ncbi:MAG: metal-dependent hydrolase [Psychromonas sp.]|nr:metal-dependent hydrolase [Psychromonas sp.]
MHIPGHLAVSIAQHCLPPFAKNKKTLAPLILAGLFPDIIDKTIGYIFKIMPNGRHFAHNIFSLVGVSLFVGIIWGKVTGLTWFAGYLGHLLTDQGRGLVPWLFPFRKYRFRKGKLFSFKPTRLLQETLFLGLVLIIHRLSR